MKTAHARIARLLAAVASLASVRADILHGPYVLLEDATVLRIRFEVDRPDYEAILIHAAGERTLVPPAFTRGTRDTFIADVRVELSPQRPFRGYELGRPGEPPRTFDWRSRLNGTLDGYPRLLVFGDSQGGHETLARLAERWGRETFDLIVGLGDLADAGSRYESWGEEFFAPLRELLPHHPFLAVCGNHDSYRGKSLEWYDWYFGRSDRRRYFALDFGDLRLIGLNNSDVHTKYGFDPIDPLTPQYDFLLERALGAGAASRKLAVFSHIPMFSGSTVVNAEFGSELQRKYLLPIMERARVLAFFAGHHHKFERLARPGWRGAIQHIVTGGGGGRLFTTARERGGYPMDREVFEVYHYLTVDFSGAGTVIARALDGTELDRFSFSPAAAPQAPPPPPEFWQAEVGADLTLTPMRPRGRAVRLIDRDASTPEPAPRAQLLRTERGLALLARNFAAAGTETVSFQGYDWPRKAWSYLQGGSLVVPAVGLYGAVAVVALNGTDLSPLDRALPVLHWPLAAVRAGLNEKAGALMLLRGERDFEIDAAPARLVGKWRWGETAAAGQAPEQRARQWALMEAGPAAEAPQPMTPADLIRLVAREGKPEGFLVRAADGQNVAVLLHWPHWHCLALIAGVSVAGGHSPIFLSTAGGLALTSEPGGLRLAGGEGATLWLPHAEIGGTAR